MAVFGGETRSLTGRVAELAVWWPFLAALLAAGGTGAISQMAGAQLPDWLAMPIGLYDGIRDWLIAAVIGPSVDPKMADLAVAGIPLVTMLSRRVLGFALSVGTFLVLAAGAWLFFKNFGHIPA